MYNIEMYRDSKGWEPVTEFLLKQKEQNPAIFEKILAYIRLLEENGTWQGMPHVEHLDGDIWELRPSPYRILFFVERGGTYVLLSWFRKKTQKTPKRELNLAKKRMKDYIIRNNDVE